MKNVIEAGQTQFYKLACCPKVCPRPQVEQAKVARLRSPNPILSVPMRRVGFNELDSLAIIRAMGDGEVIGEMERRIGTMLVDAGVQPEQADTISCVLVTDLSQKETMEEIDKIGEAWWRIFETYGYTEAIDANLMDRNHWVAGLIVPRLRSGTLLDHDSGDSYVARFIQDQRPDVRVVTEDSTDFRREVRDLPFTLYNYAEKHLPFASGTFDQALMATVLHHTDEPELMFDEVVRTVKQGGLVFLFENTFPQGDEREQKLNVAFDWFFNAVLHRTGLALPFSHYCPNEWEYFLQMKGLDIVEKVTLGQHRAIPLDHTLYVTQKR